MGVEAAVAFGAVTFTETLVFRAVLVADGAFVGAAVMKGVTADCGVP